MEENENQARVLSGISILAGIWLIIAPFVLNYSATSRGNMWQEVIIGVIIAAMGVIRLVAPDIVWPSWVNVIVGLWLIVAPWVIPNTTTAARWNEVLIGIVVAVLAYSSGTITLHHHTHQTR